MKKKVLVIDDSETVTRTTKLFLEKVGGFEVREENLSVRAIEAARDFTPDLILLDLAMPGLDGGELTDQFRTDPQFAGVPIVYYTAMISPEEVERHQGFWGGMRFISKPMRPKAMMRTLSEALAAGNN